MTEKLSLAPSATELSHSKIWIKKVYLKATFAQKIHSTNISLKQTRQKPRIGKFKQTHSLQLPDTERELNYK